MSVSESKVEIDQEKVSQILARFTLPAEIERLDVRFGTDHTGDSAVYLTFHVRDEVKIEREDIRRLSSFLAEVANALIEAGVGGFPYTRLEQAA